MDKRSRSIRTNHERRRPLLTDSTYPRERVAELLRRFEDPAACVAHLVCDQHPSDSVAYTVVEPDLTGTVLTYGELADRSKRVASALRTHGIGPSDRVATLMGKSVEYLVTVLAIWRVGAVHVPLFTAFAPPAIELRLAASACKLVFCDTDQIHKLSQERAATPYTIVVADGETSSTATGLGDFLAQSESDAPNAIVGGQGPMIHIFTSGTTGQPKGVIVPVKALAGFQAYGEFGLDLRPDDTYWCAADPGWAYGLYFGILSSLTTGTPSVLLHAGFDAELTWNVLNTQGVTNLAAAPTVYRALRASTRPAVTDLRLRCASSAGEPLTPEVNQWAADAFGLQVHDHYGQTEAGMLINNHHHPSRERPIREGSMGHSMPGWTLTVLDPDRDVEVEPGNLGRIAADLSASPLAWFEGYDNSPEQDHERFSTDRRWYLTGDTGRQDEDGYFYFSARDDDVILMAGYRIGPFEVESVLAEHPAVVECAAIAVPDELRGEVLEAFVVLGEGFEGSDFFARELQQLVKDRLAAHAYPRRVHFIAQMPKTPSGKIQRYVLRAQRTQIEVEQG